MNIPVCNVIHLNIEGGQQTCSPGYRHDPMFLSRYPPRSCHPGQLYPFGCSIFISFKFFFEIYLTVCT